MRLQATDEDIYRIMDQRERCLLACGGAAALAAASLYVFLSAFRNWETLYLFLAASICMFYFLYRGVHLGRHIMEMKSCYMEVTGESLVIRQAGKGGQHYESCRIFLDEIEKIVEGSRRGVPEFYVVKKEHAKESFFLQDDKVMEGHIFLVRSLGYQPEAFKEFYHALRWELPGSARVIGTKEQEIWGLKKPQPGLLLGTGLLLLYVVPKICLLIR